jgi:hypothetical protein
MVEVWSNWKRFPDAQHGDSLQAPIGPGVYEVRDTASGELIAFDYSAHVASALSELMPDDSSSTWWRFRHRGQGALRSRNLEYRTCATATKTEAKVVAARLSDRRHSVFNRMYIRLSA